MKFQSIVLLTTLLGVSAAAKLAQDAKIVVGENGLTEKKRALRVRRSLQDGDGGGDGGDGDGGDGDGGDGDGGEEEGDGGDGDGGDGEGGDGDGGDGCPEDAGDGGGGGGDGAGGDGTGGDGGEEDGGDGDGGDGEGGDGDGGEDGGEEDGGDGDGGDGEGGDGDGGEEEGDGGDGDGGDGEGGDGDGGDDCDDAPGFPGGFVPCFSGENTVEVMDRGFVRMDSLSIGDFVRVGGADKFGKIYSFGHYDTNVSADFLQIKTTSKSSLEISSEHMLFVKQQEATKAIPASSVKTGDILVTSDEKETVVSKITTVQRKGAYAPFTDTGDIVVSNVLSSNYISMMPEEDVFLGVDMQWIAHTFNAPHRMVCKLNFAICENETYTNGLSNWINGPFQAGRWLAQQNMAVKFAGTALLTSILSLMGPGALIVAAILALRVSKKNKIKAL